jgi:hypothetical protein
MTVMTTPCCTPRIPGLLVAAVTLLGSACGGDDSAGVTAASGGTSTIAAASAPPPPPPVTAVATTVYTVPTTQPDNAPSGAPAVITATVGIDTAADRVESVPVGANVIVVLTNPAADDEFHIHGYELGDGVSIPVTEPTSFEFVASIAGEFVIESHVTGDVLLTLVVS